MTRRRIGLAAGAVVVTAAALVAAGAYVLRPGTPANAAGPPLFVDETAASGLQHRFDGDTAYAVGGGVAVLDCDGDGLPDLYFAGGAEPAALYRNAGSVGGPLRFERVADPSTDLPNVEGAYPIDLDGDDVDDLVVLRNGENVLLRGLGDCRFERANEALGFDGAPGQTISFSATWEGAADLPTLAFGHYLAKDPDGSLGTDCDDHALLRPDAGASVYGPATTLSPGYCTLSMLFSDWDRSGRRDLRVTNDRHYYVDGMDQLWRVAEGAAPQLYTADDGWVSMQIWGMGIASYDLTGDGYPEVFLTSQGDNKLQTLTIDAGQPTYRDIALKRGVTAARPFTGGDVLPSTAWHPEFEDVNNDGFMDLLITKGNVSAQVDYASKDPSDLFLGQPDGTFLEAADRAGIISFDRGRGAALADFNLDGLLDLVLVNYGADVMLWRNVGSGTSEATAPMGHWLALELEQPGPNRDGIGAWLEVRIGDLITRREVTIGGGHAGGQLGWIHFGLGPADKAEVRVQWPDGETGPWLHLDADQFAVIDRGATEARVWQPPSH
jgi:hypothetical protein